MMLLSVVNDGERVPMWSNVCTKCKCQIRYRIRWQSSLPLPSVLSSEIRYIETDIKLTHETWVTWVAWDLTAKCTRVDMTLESLRSSLTSVQFALLLPGSLVPVTVGSSMDGSASRWQHHLWGLQKDVKSDYFNLLYIILNPSLWHSCNKDCVDAGVQDDLTGWKAKRH